MIIRPPPEIRAVADKTASFVAKNGISFELRILASSKGQSLKFSFLQDHSPFRAYYDFKIIELKNDMLEKKEKEKEKEKENGGDGGDDDKDKGVEEEKKEDKVDDGSSTLATTTPTPTTTDPLTTTTTTTVTPPTTPSSPTPTPQKIPTKSERKTKSITIDPVAKTLLMQRAIIAKADEKYSSITPSTSAPDETNPSPNSNQLVPPSDDKKAQPANTKAPNRTSEDGRIFL